MSVPSLTPAPSRGEIRFILALFIGCLAFHFWAVGVGWGNGNLPGNEFRQAQTALSAMFMQRDASYPFAYATPVLGRPWSVPMEFPLYQWVVVAVSNHTSLSLIQAGRAVSLFCFYGALAALFPLLGAFGLWPIRRLAVMSFLLSCPLYIFYARAFLIETMVLMLALWFLVAFGRLITAPTWGRWLVVAGLGVLAGLIKVTTLIVYLVPAGLWTCWAMYRQGLVAGWPRVVRLGGWGLSAIVPAIVVTAAWTYFADLTKSYNISSVFLKSSNLVDFNFGTRANRLSADTLHAHWNHISHSMTNPLVLLIVGGLLCTVSRRWWREAIFCLSCYCISLLTFPLLYAIHDYYALANAVLLLGCVGLALAGALDLRPRWVPWILLVGLHATQMWTYRSTYYDLQKAPSPGGSDMTHAINLMTDPNEVMVVAGYDWDSSLPFYSERRALMIRNGVESDRAYLTAAFQAQDHNQVTVFVAHGQQRQNRLLLTLVENYFNLDPRPLFHWEDCTVYGRKDLRGRMLDAVRRGTTLVGVKLDASALADHWSLIGQEVLTASCLLRDQKMFALCVPQPWKFYSQYGAYLAQESNTPGLFAHPDTRLWFKVPPGPHVLRVSCAVQAGAYAGLAADRTDGVEFFVDYETAAGGRERLGSLWLDPARHVADRGWHWLAVKINFPEAVNLIISTGPGAAQNYTRDWALLGAVRID